MMTKLAKGTFDVQVIPQPAEEGIGDPGIGRMALDKTFHGDLQATSKGQMLPLRTAVDGSAGYVAIECVSGSLNGRQGRFAMQHSGTMTRGAPLLEVIVIPDSGTDELVGLSGTLAITIVDGAHYYAFDYSLPDTE
jgi:hypothetical protein